MFKYLNLQEGRAWDLVFPVIKTDDRSSTQSKARKRPKLLSLATKKDHKTRLTKGTNWGDNQLTDGESSSGPGFIAFMKCTTP